MKLRPLFFFFFAKKFGAALSRSFTYLLTMFTILRQRSLKRAPSATTCLLRSFSTRPTVLLKPRCQSIPIMTRSLVYPRSPVNLMQQHRNFSLWNIPLALMTASPLKRRLALVGLGGAGLAITVILGPFLLIGVGGIAAVIGFRVWRMKRQIQQELERQTSSNLNDWPDFLNAFIQQQGQQGSFFGREQRDLQNETIKIVNQWVGSSQAREYGIPENITENVSMRGSFSSKTNNIQEIKIELELLNSPGSVLVAKAVKDKGLEQFNIKDIQLVTVNGQVVGIPLSTQNRNGGRIIEGEFHDV